MVIHIITYYISTEKVKNVYYCLDHYKLYINMIAIERIGYILFFQMFIAIIRYVILLKCKYVFFLISVKFQ